MKEKKEVYVVRAGLHINTRKYHYWLLHTFYSVICLYESPVLKYDSDSEILSFGNYGTYLKFIQPKMLIMATIYIFLHTDYIAHLKEVFN